MEIWSKCDICGRDIPVGELCYGLKKGNCICKNCCTGFENCTFTLAPMPTLTPPNEWVSVEEQLPPPNVRVLAYRPNEDDNSPYKYTNMWGWAIKESIRHKGITHWMYYPAPPDRRPPEGEEDA